MHGRTAFRLTDAERQRLRQYVERGGMLFADSICASEAFTESFRREMAAIFPDHPLEPIPPTDPLLTPAYGGFDLSTVTRHDPEKSAGPGPLKATERKVAPTLEGIKVRRPLGGGLLAVRHQLRVGEAQLAGVPRLHPPGRRADRPERAPVLAAAVTFAKTSEPCPASGVYIGVRGRWGRRPYAGGPASARFSLFPQTTAQ